MSSIPPSIDPSKITIYLRLLSKYVLVNQPEYQWSKIAELIGVEASKITELEDGDNEDNESDDEVSFILLCLLHHWLYFIFMHFYIILLVACRYRISARRSGTRAIVAPERVCRSRDNYHRNLD